MSNVTQPSTAGAYRSQYDLAFQISPIILQGGIAANAQGGLLPIVALYGQANATTGPFFAKYLPLPGSTLISQSVGMYPFANQEIAANATIKQPLTLSMHMIAPVNSQGGYLTKLATFTALQNSLQLHNASGGTYIVATPAFVYNNLLMTNIADITEGDTKQKQVEWQIDFIQPLLTLAAAAAAQSNLMATITGGGQITGTPSWSGNAQALPSNLAGITAALANFGGQL